ncbi:VOC family protein [Xanthobacter sp. TB0139]|uniref:VOC family protein n=1 Tax=Xanthobacter sp. TB0139 TaxID=3459178 RepID=UPI00403981A2
MSDEGVMSYHGKFYWNELLTDDVEKALAFYAETLGWTFQEMPMEGEEGSYFVAMMDDEPVAGLMDKTGMVPPSVPPHWFSYINVDDIDARLEKLVAAGGQVLREPFDVPGIGRIAIVADATGASMGWMTAEEGDEDEDED